MPIWLAFTDRETGERIELELNYASLTTPQAFVWERRIHAVLTVMYQWLPLLKGITEKSATSDADAVRRDERMKMER